MRYEEYAGDGSRQRKSSAQIEADLDAIRAEMAETLRQLEHKLSSRELRNMALRRLRDLQGESTRMVKRVGTSIRAKPLVPAIVLGTSIGALALALHVRRMRAERSRSLAEHAQDRVRAATKRDAPIFEDTVEEMRERAAALGKRAAAATRAARADLSAARRRAAQYTNERPYVLVGLALVAGAALAGTLRVNERRHHSLRRAMSWLKHLFGLTRQRTEEVIATGTSSNPTAEPHTGAEPGIELSEGHERHL